MNKARVIEQDGVQIVVLPKDVRMDLGEYRVVRRGSSLILRPLTEPDTLAGAFDALASIGDDFLPNGRE